MLRSFLLLVSIQAVDPLKRWFSGPVCVAINTPCVGLQLLLSTHCLPGLAFSGIRKRVQRSVPLER